MSILLTKDERMMLKKTQDINKFIEKGGCSTRTASLDSVIKQLKIQNPKAFLLCRDIRKNIKPDPLYEKCDGEAHDGSMVCAKREVCTRFLIPKSKGSQRNIDFWQAGNLCKSFVNAHFFKKSDLPSHEHSS